MEQIALRFVKIILFAALWAISSGMIMALMKKKKPGLKIYDPEVIFPSVLASALVTKLAMLALTAVMNSKD